MSESFIEPDSLNATLLALGAVVDENGSTRFINKELASYNFDGMIPTSSDTILVNELEVGMSFLPIGETEGSLKTVIKIDFDDPEMTGSPTNDYIISYLGTNGEIETVVYDGDESIEVYFEDWDDKVLGDNGWIITQEGNAIFSNVAVRGRIEATEGFLEDLGITGTLTVESGGSIVVGTDPGTVGNPGIIIDDSGLFAFDDNENVTLSITASTGEVLISALDQVIEDLEDFVEAGFDDLDSLLSSSYVANFQIFNPGTTLISGNKISTGTIDANSVSISSGGGGATQGVKINQNGITAYDSFGLPTFFLNSANGNATFIGTVSGSDVVGSTIRSSTGMTANSGNGVYLDSFGQVRFSDPDATLTFNANGLTITNNANTSNLTFNSSGLSLSGTGLSITGADIYLTGGSLISDEFSIDSLGNATFSGEIAAGVSITSPTITGGSISGATISSQSPAFPTSYITLTDSTIRFYDQGALVGGIFGDNAGGTLWAQPDLTVNGDITAFGNISVFPGGSRRFSGDGSGLTGTATSLSIGGNAATATRATNANNLDSGVVGGARITGNNVLITSIGSSTTDEILRRNSSNQMRVGGTSTIRVKKDVGPIDNLNVLDIDVVKFKYIDGYLDQEDQRNNQFIPGFIAEQLYQVLPIAVDLDENGDPQNWNQRMLIPIIVKTIQDQQKIIDELKRKN